MQQLLQFNHTEHELATGMPSFWQHHEHRVADGWTSTDTPQQLAHDSAQHKLLLRRHAAQDHSVFHNLHSVTTCTELLLLQYSSAHPHDNCEQRPAGSGLKGDSQLLCVGPVQTRPCPMHEAEV
jgi:hypothetical protein